MSVDSNRIYVKSNGVWRKKEGQRVEGCADIQSRRYRLFVMTSWATLRQVPLITAKFVCQRKYPLVAVVSGQIF